VRRTQRITTVSRTLQALAYLYPPSTSRWSLQAQILRVSKRPLHRWYLLLRRLCRAQLVWRIVRPTLPWQHALSSSLQLPHVVCRSSRMRTKQPINHEIKAGVPTSNNAHECVPAYHHAANLWTRTYYELGNVPYENGGTEPDRDRDAPRVREQNSHATSP